MTQAQPGRPKANVLGVEVDAIDMTEATRLICDASRSRSRGYVCVTGMHGVMEAQKSRELRGALGSAYLNVPDGMPTVWVGRLQGHRRMRRVFGPDLMLEICQRSARDGSTHFLYGGGPGTAQALAEALTARFPGLKIGGTYTPPFRPLNDGELRELQARVSDARPDIFWVGLSTPKQELFMSQVAPTLDAGISIGVGAAFDYHTGRLRDAPTWMKQSGLQWAHRVWQEPRRLWRRYAYNIPAFLFLLLLQFAGARNVRQTQS